MVSASKGFLCGRPYFSSTSISGRAQLPPLGAFILPGGCELAARLHLARTICRRAERAVVLLAKDHPVETSVRIYINRLSDWLFMHSRLANHEAGYEDIPWKKDHAR